MKLIPLFCAFFFFVLNVSAQDTIYHELDQKWGAATVIQKDRSFYIQGFSPDGTKTIEGDFVTSSYKYPERIYGQGSTAWSRTTGKMLTAHVKVPNSKVRTFHSNGSEHQVYHGENRSLVTFDSSGRVLEKRFFDRNFEVDSVLTYFDNGSVLCREIGTKSERTWSLMVNYERSNLLYVNNSIPESKLFYYPSGELESIWTHVEEPPNGLHNFRKEYFAKDGSKRTNLIQTNDFKNTGVLTTYYLNGNRKTEEKLYRDELHGTYRIWSENGQLIELGSKNVRISDSITTKWHENGQMKSWSKDNVHFEWFSNGELKTEYCGRYGLNFYYGEKGVVVRDNHYKTDWNREAAVDVAHYGGRDSLGFRHGVWNGFYSDSCLAYTAEFDHGFQIGLFEQYTEEGNLKRRVHFENGEANGKASFFDYYSGSLSSEGIMKDDYKSETWLTYKEAGKVHQSSRYNRGYEFIIYYQYHNNDSLSIHSEIDSLNERIVTSYFAPNGVLTQRKTQNFNGNDLIQEDFYPNGNPKSYDGRFPNAKNQVGEYVRREDVYDSLGNVVGETKSVPQRMPQIIRRYDYFGGLESEYIHGFKGENNTYKEFHSNGELKTSSIYFGTSFYRGRCTKRYYNKEGKLIKREELEDGVVMKTVPRPKSIFD